MSGLTPLISPAAAGGRAEEVVQRISEAIHLGLLSDGEKLPSEVELAAQFGVAPMTMRDALAELRVEGLVETRRGRTGGSFVRRPESPPLAPIRQRLTNMTLSGLRDFADEHQAVAGQAARLAAERASSANVRRMFSLTDQLGSAVGLGEQIRADCRFHIEVAVASQSARLTRREVSLQAEVSGMLWLPGSDGDHELAAHVEQHHAIAAAVLAQDGAEAQRLAAEHVAGSLRRLIASHLRLIDEGTGK